MTDDEIVELLAAEYGFGMEEIEKLTRREIAALINAMSERKTGYKTSLPPVNMKLSTEQEEKMKQALEKRFGKRKE